MQPVQIKQKIIALQLRNLKLEVKLKYNQFKMQRWKAMCIQYGNLKKGERPGRHLGSWLGALRGWRRDLKLSGYATRNKILLNRAEITLLKGMVT